MLFSKRLCPKNQFLQGNGVERVETLEANRAIVTKSPWGSSPKGAAQKAWNVPGHWGVALGAGNPPSNHHRRKDSHTTFYVANSSGPKFLGPEVWHFSNLERSSSHLVPKACAKAYAKTMGSVNTNFQVETLEEKRATVSSFPWGSSLKGAVPKAWNVPRCQVVVLGAGHPHSKHPQKAEFASVLTWNSGNSLLAAVKLAMHAPLWRAGDPVAHAPTR